MRRNNVYTYLVSRETRAQHWSHDRWVNIVGENSKVVCVKSNVFLEAAVFMMQVVCALDAVLLSTGKTEVAATTDTTHEANANKYALFDVIATARTNGNNSTDTFVTTDVREFDLCNRVAIGTGRSACLRMKICCESSAV